MARITRVAKKMHAQCGVSHAKASVLYPPSRNEAFGAHKEKGGMNRVGIASLLTFCSFTSLSFSLLSRDLWGVFL